MSDVAEAAVALTAELVAIDSVNPGLVPGAAGEDEIVRHLRARLDAAGFATQVVEAEGSGGRPSLVAVGPGSRGDPTVVLNGHLDTVGVAGMTAPHTPVRDGDRLSGRGAADMKGGVAALVTAAEAVVASRPPVRVVLTLVADEEDASRGSEAVITALPSLGIRPDVCVIAEPTDLTPARSLRGFAVVRVRFEGRAAHSSQPELGVNAVSHLGRFVMSVDAHALAVRARGGDLMVTVARGGDSPFVVPEWAECLVERRTAPGESAATALAEVRDLLPPGADATAELQAYREAWELDAEGPAAELATHLGDALGTSATFAAPYWMEAPLWQAVCPTLVCGPSGGGLHAADEWVDLRQVRAFAEALPGVLREWADARRAH
ncbi:MAG TPA: M20/M25/M40 family metallo-hydrolase [Lapillicoccus sp.]|jgi:acetylornithine deacetylase|uniref:M20 family metallopeptidase n=1 Tax=Lapillicoccus sp. TaxID=1909287 RepID=UPI002F955A39